MESIETVFLFVVFLSSTFANNTSYIPDCVSNDDCEPDRVCVKLTCVNPCASVCGANTTCFITNHVAMCSCLVGYSGHPVVGCQPPNKYECVSNDDCGPDKVCAKEKCVDLCPTVCGANSTCSVTNHVAVCSCSPGYSGDPVKGCNPSPPPIKCPSVQDIRKKEFYINEEIEIKWSEAVKECAKRGSQLASIESYQELVDINSRIRGPSSGWEPGFWLSGLFIDDLKTYEWTSTGNSIEPSLWMPGEPSANNSCVELASKTEWNLGDDSGPKYRLNDVPCYKLRHFICS